MCARAPCRRLVHPCGISGHAGRAAARAGVRAAPRPRRARPPRRSTQTGGGPPPRAPGMRVCFCSPLTARPCVDPRHATPCHSPRAPILGGKGLARRPRSDPLVHCSPPCRARGRAAHAPFRPPFPRTEPQPHSRTPATARRPAGLQTASRLICLPFSDTFQVPGPLAPGRGPKARHRSQAAAAAARAQGHLDALHACGAL